MARFVTAMLKTEVLPGELSVKERLGALLGRSSGWVPQKVLDMVPEEVPEWVLMVGTQVVPEGEPGLMSGATSCSLGATWECLPLGSPPSQTRNHRKCLAAAKIISRKNVVVYFVTLPPPRSPMKNWPPKPKFLQRAIN